MSNFTFTQEQLKRCHEHGAKWVAVSARGMLIVPDIIEDTFSPLAIITAWATDLLGGDNTYVQWSSANAVTHPLTGRWWSRHSTLEENLIDMCCDLYTEQQQKQPANEVVESVKRLDAEVQQLKKKVGI